MFWRLRGRLLLLGPSPGSRSLCLNPRNFRSRNKRGSGFGSPINNLGGHSNDRKAATATYAIPPGAAGSHMVPQNGRAANRIRVNGTEPDSAYLYSKYQHYRLLLPASEKAACRLQN